jgi:hypothetical protein
MQGLCPCTLLIVYIHFLQSNSINLSLLRGVTIIPNYSILGDKLTRARARGYIFFMEHLADYQCFGDSVSSFIYP